MKISTKGRYGTRAILEIARRYGQSPIKRSEIAESQSVPDSYLENILIALKKAGLIRTIRGAHGGYQLAKSPDDISVLDIVEVLEGTIVPVSCIEENRSDCIRNGRCVTRQIWNEMYDAIRSVLGKYSLKDLLEQEQTLLGVISQSR
jgi:Rrf2 family protein